MDSNPDRPLVACQPVCDFEQSEGGMAVCPTCGSVWREQQVTQVDPVTFRPTLIERAWVRT